jgi:hypothetical protein
MSKRLLLTLTALLALTACGVSSQTSNDTSPSPASTPSAAASPSPPTLASLDPCKLVTAQEASQLSGTTYDAGVEQTADNGARECIYSRQSLSVFVVMVNVATDAATAEADWATTEADAQSGLQQLAGSEGASVGLQAGNITLPGANEAATAAASGAIGGNHTLNISAIYVLKGAVFFMFSDLVLDKSAASASAMATLAATTLTRIP